MMTERYGALVKYDDGTVNSISVMMTGQYVVLV